MAGGMGEGLRETGVDVKIFDVNQSDRTDIIGEMLDAKGYLIGSSTHDNDMLPNMAGFLEFLKGLKPKNRVAAVFGSYGWAGGAVGEIEGVLKQGEITIAQPSLSVKYLPDAAELERCYTFGKDFVKAL